MSQWQPLFPKILTWFLLLKTVNHRAFIYNTISGVLKFTRSKVKVTCVKFVIIKSEGTYPIPTGISKVTSCQSYHFYNIYLSITGSLYLVITLLSKNIFD